MTDGGPDITATVSINYSVEARDGHLAARTKQFGLTVYAPSEEGLKPRMEEAVNFYMEAFDGDLNRALEYLSRHQISYSLEYPDPLEDGANNSTAECKVVLA